MFQKRFEGSVDFYLSWNDYKYGFGDVNGEFRLGLEKIHALTPDDNNMLRVDLEDFGGNTRYAEYNMFGVTSENDKCKLNLGSYSCNIMKFSPPTTHKRNINVIGIAKITPTKLTVTKQHLANVCSDIRATVLCSESPLWVGEHLM